MYQYAARKMIQDKRIPPALSKIKLKHFCGGGVGV
jgi:hypothetical protein